jgi:hypothetical protein
VRSSGALRLNRPAMDSMRAFMSRQQQQPMRRKYVLGINDAGYIVDYYTDAGGNVYGFGNPWDERQSAAIASINAKPFRGFEAPRERIRCAQVARGLRPLLHSEGPRSDAGRNGGPSFA